MKCKECGGEVKTDLGISVKIAGEWVNTHCCNGCTRLHLNNGELAFSAEGHHLFFRSGIYIVCTARDEPWREVNRCLIDNQ